MKYLKFLWSLVRHKWYVFVECCKLGIVWQGVIHDLSKFLPREFVAYAWSFYGPWKYKERPQWLVDLFDVAWLHHQKRNPHHWQYWLLVQDDDPDKTLPMPDKDGREMLADWRGAGTAYGNPDTKGWYLKRREKWFQRLHPETRRWIEKQLGVTNED